MPAATPPLRRAATSPGVPIYWLAGGKVADNYSDFYDGSWDSNAPTDESGTVIATGIEVFTGSNSNGSGFEMRQFGTDADTVRIGRPGSAGRELDGGQDREKTQSHSFYGFSDIFTIYTFAPLQLTTAVVDGATLTLTYSETLDSEVSASGCGLQREGGKRAAYGVECAGQGNGRDSNAGNGSAARRGGDREL